MINYQIRNRVFRHLENGGVDQRICKEVIPAPPEHLLDGSGEIRVGYIEEG